MSRLSFRHSYLLAIFSLATTPAELFAQTAVTPETSTVTGISGLNASSAQSPPVAVPTAHLVMTGKNGEHVTSAATKPGANTIEISPALPAEAFSALLPANWDAQREAPLGDAYDTSLLPAKRMWTPLAGVHTWLRPYGIGFQAMYKGENLTTVDGGKQRGTDYLHEVNFRLDLDLEKLVGLNGWSTHMIVLERAGTSAGKDQVGEYYINLAELYGVSGHAAAHLAYFYAQKRLFDNRMDLTFGRMPLTIDFATSPLDCTFMLLCSAPVALKLNQGISVYPKGSWGGRVRVRPTRDTVFQIGVYDSTALSQNLSGWAWSSEKSMGTMVPIEFTWQPFFGPDRLVGHYKFGYEYDTTKYADELGTLSAALLKSYSLTYSKARRESFWVLADQMIYRNAGKGQMDGGYLMAGYVHNTAHVSIFQDEAWAGASFSGIIPSRPHERLGILYTYYRVSHRLELGQEIRQENGKSLGASVAGPQADEGIIEVNYGINLRPGLLFQPEYEYVIHPGETTHIPNASLIGMKLFATL